MANLLKYLLIIEGVNVNILLETADQMYNTRNLSDTQKKDRTLIGIENEDNYLQKIWNITHNIMQKNDPNLHKNDNQYKNVNHSQYSNIILNLNNKNDSLDPFLALLPCNPVPDYFNENVDVRCQLTH